MLESNIEKSIRRKIEAIGGKFYKWNSGVRGVPDRICILPGGRIIFVETKQEKRTPAKLQAYQIARLRELGCDVRIVAGRKEAEGFVEEVTA
ncbi:MAG: VRR-NUC domain-containing protein [Bacillota bacterium]|nr:VRR-NUC domain-containing protein [Bacillota bacterium]